jgi:beta-lactamase regulating signal transducer with metallopeptidase domain
MSALAETLLTALVLSGLAALCLALLPQAPPRLRFAVAVAGLVVWLIPWSAIRSVAPAIVIPATDVPTPLAAPFAATRAVAAVAAPGSDIGGLLAYVLAGASALGLALFARDWLALRRCTRRWRAASRRADHLRSLLPPELEQVDAELRVVADSDVAAASGFRKPTIWIGDRFAGERLRLVVVHEMWHVRACDPVWIASIAAVRRVLWWNPLVAHLAREAVLMIESTCDERSAAVLGKPRYIGELASLVLAKATPAPGLIATLQTANFDVQRLRLLGTTLRLRARHLAVVAVLGVGAAATAMSNVVEREAAVVGEASPGSAPPTSRAALRPSGDAAVLDELLEAYAYTPQQHLGEL